MEALGLKKPLIVVVNEALMDDHQWELAEALADQVKLLSLLGSYNENSVYIFLHCAKD